MGPNHGNFLDSKKKRHTGKDAYDETTDNGSERVGEGDGGTLQPKIGKRKDDIKVPYVRHELRSSNGASWPGFGSDVIPYFSERNYAHLLPGVKELSPSRATAGAGQGRTASSMREK